MPAKATRPLFMAPGNPEPSQTPSPVPRRGGRKAAGFLPYPPPHPTTPPPPSKHGPQRHYLFAFGEVFGTGRGFKSNGQLSQGCWQPGLKLFPSPRRARRHIRARQHIRTRRRRAQGERGCNLTVWCTEHVAGRKEHPPVWGRLPKSSPQPLHRSPVPTEHPRQPELPPGSPLVGQKALAPSLEV